MKNLIKKILREHIESDSSQLEKRLRTLFSTMQDIKGIDNVVSCVSSKKNKDSCVGSSDAITTMREVLDLLRLFGYHAVNHMRGEQFDTFYWLATCFIANGGYARNFSQAPIEAINLELIVREMQAEYDEERIETRDGWGDLYDMSDDEDAAQYFLDNFESLMQDSEHIDDDYGEVLDVRGSHVAAHRTIKLNPDWIGLK
jgi:hypothetical protein